MMTPQQIDALHAMNDFMSEALARLRTHQSRVTHMLATAAREHDYAGSDQERTEAMLSLRQIPYAVLPYEGSTRVDLGITTAFEGSGDEDEVINIEFQFDDGQLIGLRTLLGKRV